jgi:hypothetical protein
MLARDIHSFFVPRPSCQRKFADKAHTTSQCVWDTMKGQYKIKNS